MPDYIPDEGGFTWGHLLCDSPFAPVTIPLTAVPFDDGDGISPTPPAGHSKATKASSKKTGRDSLESVWCQGFTIGRAVDCGMYDRPSQYIAIGSLQIEP